MLYKYYTGLVNEARTLNESPYICDNILTVMGKTDGGPFLKLIKEKINNKETVGQHLFGVLWDSSFDRDQQYEAEAFRDTLWTELEALAVKLDNELYEWRKSHV